MKYGGFRLDEIEDIIDKLGGVEGAQRFRRGEITVSEPERSWREEDGVIRFSVNNYYCMAGEDWIGWLERKGFRLSNYVKSILCSPDFKWTFNVPYKIAVLKGFTDNDRVEEIRAEAHRRGLVTPKAEVACLIREKFSDKELEDMGLWWIVTMHEPIEDSYGDMGLLRVDRSGGGRWLSACYGNPGVGWRHAVGFAFEVVNS